jgi:hypothetical protein
MVKEVFIDLLLLFSGAVIMTAGIALAALKVVAMVMEEQNRKNVG